MKTTNSFLKGILSLLSLIYSLGSFSQAPQAFSYQAVIRNASNALVSSTPIGMRISILQGSATGTTIYTETHQPTSNTNGLVNVIIGSGSNPSGFFSALDWSTGLFFIKTETDPTGGTNYTITATSQLLSVPFALNSADNKWAVYGNEISNKNIGNVAIGKTFTSTYGHGGSSKVLEIHNPDVNYDAQSHIMLSSGSPQSFGSLGGINYVLPGISTPEKRMAYIGSEYNSNNGVNRGASLNFWTQNSSGNLNNNMSISNAGVVSTPFSPNTNLSVGGYTKLGQASPGIKVTKITTTTSALQGGNVFVSHYINFAKILSVSVIVDYDGTQYFPASFTQTAGFQFNYYLDVTYINILNSATNSGNILSKPVKILITYEE